MQTLAKQTEGKEHFWLAVSFGEFCCCWCFVVVVVVEGIASAAQILSHGKG